MEIFIGVAANRINNVLERIEDSPAGPSSYRRLEKLWLASFINPSDPFPINWIHWRNLLVKFGLFTSRPASAFAFLVRDLAGRAINQTYELS